MQPQEKSERRRVARHATCGPIEVIDVESGASARVRLMDLSLAGCEVEAGGRFLAGSKVKVRIRRSDGVFEALGVVVRSDPRTSAGIQFKGTNPENEATIQHWLAELGQNAPSS